jgi:aryl-alcohol dehydrogenase-like predicted oxidoreductase
VLTGKYGPADVTGDAQSDVVGSRRDVIASSGRLTTEAIALGALVRDIAADIGATPSQIAIAWLLRQPACTAPILGARTASQLEDNLGALDVALTDEVAARLDEASRPTPIFPDRFLARPMIRQIMSGQTEVEQRAGA